MKKNFTYKIKCAFTVLAVVSTLGFFSLSYAKDNKNEQLQIARPPIDDVNEIIVKVVVKDPFGWVGDKNINSSTSDKVVQYLEDGLQKKTN